MIRLFRYIVYNSWIVVIAILSLFYNDRIISYIVAICNYVTLQALYPVVLIVSYEFRLSLHLIEMHGTRVRFILWPSHLLVFEPSYYFCDLRKLGCGLTYLTFSLPAVHRVFFTHIAVR